MVEINGNVLLRLVFSRLTFVDKIKRKWKTLHNFRESHSLWKSI